MTHARGAAALAGLVLATSGCGLLDEGSEPTSSTSSPTTSSPRSSATTTPSAPPAPLELRRVEEDATGGDGGCSRTPTTQPDPQKQVTACDEEGHALALEPAEVVGGVDEVKAQRDQWGNWNVFITLGDAAAEDLARVTRSLEGTDTRLAILCQGVVLSAPTVNQAILDGHISLSADYSRAEARQLAKRVRATQDAAGSAA